MSVYRFDIEHRHDGGVRVTCDGLEHHDERGLARKLVNAGAEDGPIEVGRPGRVDYRVISLHAFAAGALEEGDQGIRIRTYRPHPDAKVSPSLQHAISSRVWAVKNGRKHSTGITAPECVENALATA